MVDSVELKRARRASVVAAGLLAGLCLAPSWAHADSPGAGHDVVTPGTWQEVDLGPEQPGFYRLSEVADTASGDVLVTESGQDVRCWNGSTWTRIAQPDLPDTYPNYYVYDLGGVSCTDFYLYDRIVTDTGSTSGRWHWNGAQWQRTATGEEYPPDFFYAAGPHDEWDFSTHIAHHFDGTTWHDVAMPANLGYLESAAGSSGTDIWVTGPSKDYTSELAFHWTGTGWRQYTLPDRADKSAINLVVVSPTEAYAFDYHTTSGYVRWDGTAWHEQTFPFALPAKSSWVSAATHDAGTVWLGVGYNVYRLDNGTWTQSPLPAVTETTPIDVMGMAADPRSHTVVAAGNAGGETEPRPVLLTHTN